MRRKLNAGSATHRLLIELLDEFSDWSAVMSRPMGVMMAGGPDAYLEKRRWRKTRQQRDAVEELKRRDFLQIHRRGNAVYAKLTDEGFAQALRLAIIGTTRRIPKPGRCYVSFDIPQSVRHLRTVVRELLKEARFQMVHQSLWMTDRAVARELSELIRRLKAEDWIHVCVGEPMTRFPHRKP